MKRTYTRTEIRVALVNNNLFEHGYREYNEIYFRIERYVNRKGFYFTYWDGNSNYMMFFKSLGTCIKIYRAILKDNYQYNLENGNRKRPNKHNYRIFKSGFLCEW